MTAFTTEWRKLDWASKWSVIKLVMFLPVGVLIFWFAFNPAQKLPRCDVSQLQLSQMSGLHGQSSGISGILTNTSGTPVAGVSVRWKLYDSAGDIVGTANARIDDLEPGARWRFNAPTTTADYARTGKCGIAFYSVR